ncbi:MAG TPA: TIGR03790 family protein [Chthoniobacterales bacterium]|nr:TIGR03790 family protein [Chthoniobacterales bacterium]
MPTRSPTLNSQLTRIFVALIVSLVLSREAAAAETSLPALTVVVYNKTAPEAADLARFYAEKRGIAPDHVIGLTCSLAEEITRDEYDSTIANRLREIFKAKQWWTTRETEDHHEILTATSIRFVALIRGMPLKIHMMMGEPYPGDKRGGGPVDDRNEASVDSELATLGYFTPQISGAITNPYFKSFKSIDQLEEPALLLVCRLDAPTAATVKQMILDSLAAEKNGLWGRAYVDSAHGPSAGYDVGDKWLSAIPPELHKVGIPVVFHSPVPGIFPEGYPMTDCALYYGWYAPNIAGPFVRSDFRFVPGAIAMHIHSFSAGTLRDRNANWVGPLVSRGAAASIGNVYEPYLQLTTQPDILNDRLLHGFTFAESAYSATGALSWMGVMVGDPLYRPYLNWIQIDSAPVKPSAWKFYHDFAARNFSSNAAQYRASARQAAARAHDCPMIEDLGLMEAGDGNLASATSFYGQARTCYSTRDDLLRVIIEEADAWNHLKKPKRGLDLLRTALRIAGDAPAASVLRQVEQQLRGVPPPLPGASPLPSPTPKIRIKF